MKVSPIVGAKGVDYDDSPQRSPRWLDIHSGRVGSSKLKDWMAVAKRADKNGVFAPLKSRADMEREVAFEKAFGVPFSKYMTGAMQAGIDNEDFVRTQYAEQMGVTVEQAGAFYDKWSIASPDGLIGLDGGCEIKWLQDSNWTEVVVSGEPLDDHVYQIQGNLRLSGRKWWDYIAANENTGRFIVIRVFRDEALISAIDISVREVENVKPLSAKGLFEFSGQAPAVVAPEEGAVVWA